MAQNRPSETEPDTGSFLTTSSVSSSVSPSPSFATFPEKYQPEVGDRIPIPGYSWVASKERTEEPAARWWELGSSTPQPPRGVFVQLQPFSAEFKEQMLRDTHAAPFGWEPQQAERLSLKPILHQDIWKLYESIEGARWVPEEIDRTYDKADWDNRMIQPERDFVQGFLAFFSHADLEVLDLLELIVPHVQDVPEARLYFNAQRAQEGMHTNAYDMQIEGLELDTAQLNGMRRAFKHDPVIRKMFEWIGLWKDPNVPIGDLLIADACVEGVLFQGAFAALQWLREKNLLPGITEFNFMIMTDEGLHTIAVGAFFRRLKPWARPTQKRAHEIAHGAVSCAVEFVGHIIPSALIGMTKELLAQYIRFQTDCIMDMLGYSPIYRLENPFPFMDQVSLKSVAKTNFLERRNLSYRELSGVEGAMKLKLRTDPIKW